MKAKPEDDVAKIFWRLLLIPVGVILDHEEISRPIIGVAIETSRSVSGHIDIAIGVNGDVIISIYISSSGCRVHLLKSRG